MSDNFEYRVDFDVDTGDLSRAEREVDDLVDATEELSRAEIDLDADDATRAIQALNQRLDDLDNTVTGTGRAVKALGAAAGEGFDSTRIEQMVLDLRDMGLTFDQIEAKAEQFADVMKRADDIKLDAANQGLTQVGTNLDRVRDSGDQSRSVLANMAGNSAQDLGELGGVVGTLGVGIGQLAEYAVDGNIKLSNLAKVAGPMAGLTAAGLALTKVLGDMSKAAAFDKERIEGINEAIEEGGDAWDYFREQVADTGQVLTTTDGIIGGFGRKTTDVRDELDRLGLSFQDFQNLVADPAALQALIDYRDTLSGGEFAQERSDILQVVRAVEDYTGAIGEATGARQALTEFLGPPPRTGLTEINEELKALNVDADALDRAWQKLLADMADNGVVDSTNEWHQLKQALQLTDAEMAELATQKLDEKMRADSDALAEIAAAADDAREAIADILADVPDISGVLETELGAASDVLDGVRFDVNFDEALAGALEGLEGFGPDLQTLADEWANILGGADIDVLGNVSTDDAEALDKLSALGDLFREGVVREFGEGGTAAANEFARTTAEAIAAQTGLSLADVYKIMGLPADGTIDTLIRPEIDAAYADRARRIMDAIVAGTSGDPRFTARTAQIQVLLETGEIEPEIAALVAQMRAAQLGLAIYPQVDEETTQAELDEAQAILDNTPVPLTVEADLTEADNQMRGFMSRVRVARVGAEADPSVKRTDTDLSNVARSRTANIDSVPVAQLVQALLVNALLDHAARPRTANIAVVALSALAQWQLDNFVNQSRTVTVDVKLGDVPTYTEIVSRMTGGTGRIVIPVDVYQRNVPRIAGARGAFA